MAVSYSVNADSFVAEKPRVWIDKLAGRMRYDLAPDGKRVAVITPVTAADGEAPKPDHEVVTSAELFRRAAAARTAIWSVSEQALPRELFGTLGMDCQLVH